MVIKIKKSKLALLIAAEKEFALRGLAGARLATVAKNANVKSQASLNYHFGTRESMFLHTLMFRLPSLMAARDVMHTLVKERINDDNALESWVTLAVAPSFWLCKVLSPTSYTGRLWSQSLASYINLAEMLQFAGINKEVQYDRVNIAAAIVNIIGDETEAARRLRIASHMIDHALAGLETEIHAQHANEEINIDRLGLYIDDFTVTFVRFICRALVGSDYNVDEGLIRQYINTLEFDAPDPAWVELPGLTDDELASHLASMIAANESVPIRFRDTGDQKTTLLEAAEALVARHCEDGVSLNMIGEAVDTSEANVLYHFKKKADLLDTLRDLRTPSIQKYRATFLDEAAKYNGGEVPVEQQIWALVAPPSWLITQLSPSSNFYQYVFNELYSPGLHTLSTKQKPFAAAMDALTEKFYSDSVLKERIFGAVGDANTLLPHSFWRTLQRSYIAFLVATEKRLNMPRPTGSKPIDIVEFNIRHVVEIARFLHEGLLPPAMVFDTVALRIILTATNDRMGELP